MKNIYHNLLFSIIFLFILLGCAFPAWCQDPKQILSIEAYDMLNTVPDTYLIDVRTQFEYQFIGHPNNAYNFPFQFLTNEIGKVNENLEYTLSEPNKQLVAEISKVFKKTDNLIIIDRDGIRSAAAAKVLIKAGFKNIYDVTDGFEGVRFPSFEDKNKDKFYRQLAKRNKIYGYDHRRHYGWQWWGLPWTYDLDIKFIYPPDRPLQKE